MIALDQVTKRYGDTVSLDSLSLHIKEGEFFGLLGPNGAGKTTLIRIISALTVPTSGRVLVAGEPVNRNNTKFKSQIGLVPQHNNLEPELTVVENLQLHGMLYGIPKKESAGRIKELLDFTRLTDKADTQVGKLSGGMKRKLLIARALMHKPAILLLDEPTVGLDVSSRRKVWDLIKGLHKRGITIVLTTHYLEEAEALCTKIGLLKKGRLLMSGSLDELKNMVGPVVVEQFYNDKTVLYFYKDQKEALKAASSMGEGITVRQSRLEDIFVKLTEEKSE
ncbi:ABC-2 type transport system ATP-binding protein [Desulfohalotomaculum tongense]|nr:ABC transporter ATP-binding protein [Desulforadius tongensis]MBM7854892.1 ABC-2 type transport system ATP-binding protein [Desulforadius tongensis]